MKSREFAVVTEQTEIASGIFSLWLETESIAKEAVPGQFVSVYSKDKSRMLPRPISICEADKENGKLRLVYRVVGATYPEQGEILRKVMPKSFILVPGYGAQGGKGKDLVHFFNEDGLGAIVNSSRGIIAAYKQEAYAKFGAENFGDASRAAVEAMIADIQGALTAAK